MKNEWNWMLDIRPLKEEQQPVEMPYFGEFIGE